MLYKETVEKGPMDLVYELMAYEKLMSYNPQFNGQNTPEKAQKR
jgi:hypothetical protein